MTLAPIGLSVYTRVEHVKQTIYALAQNRLASESELFVFSDAAKGGDEGRVRLMREYIATIAGFKSVIVVEREVNSRVNNNRGGIQYLLDTYGKVIWMEEDIVTAKGFLTFMNTGLNFYKDNDQVISISGYTPPFCLPSDYKKDFICLQRSNVWGVGFWKSKFDRIQMKFSPEQAKHILNNKKFFKELRKNGDDIPGMVKRDLEGSIDALDVKIMCQQVLNNSYSISPRRSLVQNIGHDGTGVHCGVSSKFFIDGLWDKESSFDFQKCIEVDSRIAKRNYNFRKRSALRKLTFLLKNQYMFKSLKRFLATLGFK